MPKLIKTDFQLQQVNSDGTKEEPRLHKIEEIDGSWHMDRRGFLITSAVGLTFLNSRKAELLAQENVPPQGDNKSIQINEGCQEWVKASQRDVVFLGISQDGKLLVSGSFDDTIKLWELPSGNLIKTLTEPIYCSSSLAISPDGKLIVLATDNTIILKELPSGRRIKTLTTEFHNDVYSLAISPDSKLLVARLYHAINLWELPSGNLVKTLIGHTRKVTSSIISPDGKLLVSASDDETIKLWELPSGNLLKTLTEHTDSVRPCLVISPDGKFLVSGSEPPNETIKFWELPSGNLIKTLTEPDTDYLTFLTISPDSKLLASGSGSGAFNTIKLW